MRRLRNLLIIIIIVVAGYWILKRLDIVPSISNLFTAQPVVIDQTPILIKEIRSLGQLITYSSYDEVVADSIIASRGSTFINSFNSVSPIPLLPSTEKQLVLIGRGKVLAGTNLALLSDNNIKITNDSVMVQLPPVQILDAIVNPADFETFVEKGDWTSTEVALVKTQARRKMIDRALQQNILQKADARSKTIMQSFIENLGYQYVLVH